MKASTKTMLVAVFAASLSSLSFAATAEENWNKHCKLCHGADGNGTTTAMGKKLKLKDYTSAEAQAAMTDEEMFKAIKEGVKDAAGKQIMPGYEAKGLTDDDINALVAYIRAMKK